VKDDRASWGSPALSDTKKNHKNSKIGVEQMNTSARLPLKLSLLAVSCALALSVAQAQQNSQTQDDATTASDNMQLQHPTTKNPIKKSKLLPSKAYGALRKLPLMSKGLPAT
jgi:hypothetical protein